MESSREERVKYIWFSHDYPLFLELPFCFVFTQKAEVRRDANYAYSSWPCSRSLSLCTRMGPEKSQGPEENEPDLLADGTLSVSHPHSSMSSFTLSRIWPCPNVGSLCGLSRRWEALGIPPCRCHLTWGKDGHDQSVWWQAYFPWPVVKQIQLNLLLHLEPFFA